MGSESKLSSKKISFLLISIFLTSSCALIYELLIAAICSYFLGDSITQFSLVIGIFISSMGVGSYLTRFIRHDLLYNFFCIEIILGVIGGLSIPALYVAFAYTTIFSPLAFTLTFIIGVLVGFEIPLITRELSGKIAKEKNISNVLSVDYIGGLAATLLFPFVLIPTLGLFKTSLLFGLINIAIGIFGLNLFQGLFQKKKSLFPLLISTFVFIILLTGLLLSDRLIDKWESTLYADEIVHSEQTVYQKIVVTSAGGDTRLFLNGNLQFSSQDEYRYHESLVHIPLGLAKKRNDILVLGGGDGLAVREILKYKDVEKVILVDLDKRVTEMSGENRFISSLNKGSLHNKRVEIVNDDAFRYLLESNKVFDVIIADLPDPNNVSLAKLYSREFYKLIGKRLAPSGIFNSQSTSPFYSKKAFWSIKESIKAAGLPNVYPYHLNIPSFGEWGFILASKKQIDLNRFSLDVATRYLTNEIGHLFYFEKDIDWPGEPPEVSSLDKPVVLSYYLEGWSKYK